MDKDFIEQLRKTDSRTLLFAVIAFLALIGPVALEINIVDPDLYRALSVSKITLLALGAVLPVGILNTILSFEATRHDPPLQLLPGTPDLNASAGLSITAFVLYTDLSFQFLFQYSLRTFIAVGLILELLVIVWSIAQIVNARRQSKGIAKNT